MMYRVFLTVIFYVKSVKPEMEGFIMEGEYTNIQRYPHQVYIEILGDLACACGGSILNQAIILTAAHCLDEYSGNKNQRVLVKYGSHDLNKMRMKVVKSYIKHKEYEVWSMYADIALLRCKTPITLGVTVQKVAIMEKPPKGFTAYVTGWGAVNINFDTQDVLKHTKQEIQNDKICSKLSTPQGAFCAGPIHGPGKPSVGDSGGALVIDNYIQIGIVSYKIEEYTLVAYTNVSYFYSWIYRNAARLYCNKR